MSLFAASFRRFFGQPLCLLALGVGLLIAARADGPVPGPEDRFGRPGIHEVTTTSVPSPLWPGHEVTVKLPAGVQGPVPVWFFAHGFAGTDPVFYRELLDHLASHGAAVVFSPYPANLKAEQNYDIMFVGFEAAVEAHHPELDLARVGFIGHSYGGGAIPALALRGVRERGWGREGLALMGLAPWYSFELSDAELAHLPEHTQLVVQVYADDLINDHRMAIDLFRHNRLPSTSKTFLLVHSDRIDGYNYEAGHHVPTGAAVPRPGAAFNALDQWAVLRLAQALGASAWTGDGEARMVALGTGRDETVTVGQTPDGRMLRPMERLTAPEPLFPSSRYQQRWNGLLNPRFRPLSPPTGSRLSNLSVRAYSGPGDQVLIAGAALSGSRRKNLLLRAVGPGLEPYGVSGYMPDPVLVTFNGEREDLMNDDWGDAASQDTLRQASEDAGAFALADGSADAALLASFAPGSLTAHVRPNGAPGIVLLEFYDVEVSNGARLVNLSARGRVGAGEHALIAGFVTSGEAPLTLLLRGVGPALADFGLDSAVADPVLELYRERQLIAENDNWSADEVQATSARVGAFPLPPGSADAALVVTLPAGHYTAQLRSADPDRTGLGLMEIYLVP